jgi:hypothetical protein
MDAELLDLSRRLIRHPKGPKPSIHLRYAAKATRDERGLWVPIEVPCPECDGTGRVEVEGTESGESACFADCNRGRVEAWVLDLTDDATGGVLLGMLWSADPSLHVHRDGDSVIVHVAPRVVEHTGPSLGAAAASALLACWG